MRARIAFVSVGREDTMTILSVVLMMQIRLMIISSTIRCGGMPTACIPNRSNLRGFCGWDLRTRGLRARGLRVRVARDGFVRGDVGAAVRAARPRPQLFAEGFVGGWGYDWFPIVFDVAECGRPERAPLQFACAGFCGCGFAGLGFAGAGLRGWDLRGGVAGWDLGVEIKKC